jgi:hypothetical protein
MVEFVVASRVKDHDDGGVEDCGDEGSRIMAMARLKTMVMKGSKIMTTAGSKIVVMKGQRL